MSKTFFIQGQDDQRIEKSTAFTVLPSIADERTTLSTTLRVTTKYTVQPTTVDYRTKLIRTISLTEIPITTQTEIDTEVIGLTPLHFSTYTIVAFLALLWDSNKRTKKQKTRTNIRIQKKIHCCLRYIFFFDEIIFHG